MDVDLWKPLLSFLGMKRKKWYGRVLVCALNQEIKGHQRDPSLSAHPCRWSSGWWDPAAETRAGLVIEMRRLWIPILRGSEGLDSIGDPRTMAEQFWWNLRCCIERKLQADSGTHIKGNRFSLIACDSLLFCLLLSLSFSFDILRGGGWKKAKIYSNV